MCVSAFRNRSRLARFPTNSKHHYHCNRFLSSISLPHSSSSPPMALDFSDDDIDKYGFNRPGMSPSSLANTVDPYDRHVFLCYKSHQTWPPKIEDSDDHPLPKLLSSAIKFRKHDIPLKTRLTMFSGDKWNGCSDGDVLIFPEMIKYRGLKVSDVGAFVEDVLVTGKPWASGVPEGLTGAYLFVCAHASRDKRCGVCGTILIDFLMESVERKGLSEKVFVSACSHVGGHKYAGNVIIFCSNAEGKAVGHWYGYVTPGHVDDLLEVHIGKGKIIEKLWRGQMTLREDGTQKEHKTLSEENVPAKTEEQWQTETETKGEKKGNLCCCQGASGVSCCSDVSSGVDGNVEEVNPMDSPEESCKSGGISLPVWMGKWEQSDVLLAAAIVGAVATVTMAYSFYRRSS